MSLRYLYSRGNMLKVSRGMVWFATIGIALGVSALITILSVMNGFETELVNRILRVIPQAVVTTPTGRLDPLQFPAVRLMAYPLPGLQQVVPCIQEEVILQSQRGVTMGMMLGIRKNSYEPLMSLLITGEGDLLYSGRWKIILGAQLAQQLGVQVGDQLRLTVTKAMRYTPVGPLPSQRLFTVAALFAVGSEVDNGYVLVNRKDAEELLHYPTQQQITGWRLFFAHPLRLTQLSVPPLPAPLLWHDWRETQGALFQAVKMEQLMMGLLLALIILISLFNLVTALALQVTEQASEIAILQTQGMTRRQVIQLLMLQGLGWSGIGVVLGVGIGVLLTHQINALFSALGIQFLGWVELPVVVDIYQLVLIVSATLLLSLFATFYPAWRATQLDPVAVLRCSG